jgi:multimeric flavodoxin WrbA
MKVVAFNGSARQGGNTEILIGRVCVELEKQGIQTERVSLAQRTIRGCIACGKCAENKDRRCAVEDDAANGYIGKMLAADGIILGSPVYFQDVTPEMKALIDRAGFVSRANGRMLSNRVGAAVAALRRTGGVGSIDTMNHFFLSGEMVIVGRAIGFGMERGEVEKDAEGIQQAVSLGQRMGWLLERLRR